MEIQGMNRFSCHPGQRTWVVLLLIVLGSGDVATAQEKGLTVRDIHVGFVAKGVVNDRASFRSTLPSVVLSQRPSSSTPSDSLPQPLGVITFSGSPLQNVDVMLEYDQQSRLLGRWPHTSVRSTRSLWRKFNVISGKSPLTTPFPVNSWLNPLRQADRLMIEKEKSVERFILYDISMKSPATIELESAEDGYKARHLGANPLHHVMVYRPTGGGKYRAAIIDELPAGSVSPAPPPVEGNASQTPPTTTPSNAVADAFREVKVAITGEILTSPAAQPVVGEPSTAPAGVPSNIAQTAIPWVGEPQTSDELIKLWEPILRQQGLETDEITFVQTILKTHAFDKESARIVVQLAPEAIEKLVPLEVTPQPDKLVRVWLLIIDGADPDIKTRIQGLIAQLGDADYGNRMQAKKELLKLGPTAVPELNAHKGHQDAEVSFRVQELLEEILEPTVQENSGDVAIEGVIDF